MKFKIEYEEEVKRINTVTIEVESEEEGEEIADHLAVMRFQHADDIKYEIGKLGKKITDTCEGAEDCHYEII